MPFDDEARDVKRPPDAVARVTQLARPLGADEQAVLLLVAEQLLLRR